MCMNYSAGFPSVSHLKCALRGPAPILHEAESNVVTFVCKLRQSKNSNRIRLFWSFCQSLNRVFHECTFYPF